MTHLNYYSPVYDSFANLMNDIFANDTKSNNKVSTLPAVNVMEREKDYVIELAAPGLKKENFDIELDNEMLIVKSNVEMTEEKAQYTKREFSYNNFERVFTLPDTVDVQNIDAEYKDGILSLTIAKKPEAQVMPKRIISIN